MTGTWAEIGLLKEARYSLLFLFESDHFFLLIETMFFSLRSGEQKKFNAFANTKVIVIS